MMDEIKYFIIDINKVHGGWQVNLAYAGALVQLISYYVTFKVGKYFGAHKQRRQSA